MFIKDQGQRTCRAWRACLHPVADLLPRAIGITASVGINITIGTQGDQCDTTPLALVRGERDGNESRCFEWADNALEEW